MMKRKKPIRYRRIAFVVSFIQPRGANIEACRSYVEDAVTTWRGQCRPAGSYNDNDPGDPMFDLDANSVKVRRYNARKREAT